MISIPFARDPWNEVIPGLWQGGLDYKADPDTWYADEAIVGDEFDLVISLYRRIGHGPADGVEHWTGRIPDGVLNGDDRALVAEAVDRVLIALEAGKRVLVRCQAGYNRSGLVVALALLALGHTADEAIALIREKRSEWALCNQHFCDYIRQRAAVKGGAR